MDTRRSGETAVTLTVLMATLSTVLAAQQTHEELWIVNTAGQSIHIYEVDTWGFLEELQVGETPHGLVVAPDQRTAYTMLENLRSDQVGELVEIDTRTHRITERFELDGRPNEGEITPDGRFLYLPDHNQGKWWIIDIDPYPRGRDRPLQVVGTIVTGGRPHNTMSDGRYMYLAPMEHSYTYIVDPLLGHQVVGAIDMGLEHGDNVGRPFDVSADGTRLFQSVDGMIGFKVADIEQRKVIREVHFPGVESRYHQGVSSSRTHGTAVRPDQKEVWTSYMRGGQVAVYEMESGNYELVDLIQMPGENPDIYWINHSPDSRYAYVALLREQKMAVVDADTKEIVTLLDTGPGPKRMMHISVPLDDGEFASDPE